MSVANTGTNESALTNAYFIPYMHDIYYNSNPIFYAINKRKEIIDGTDRVQVPFLIGGLTARSYKRGYTFAFEDPTININGDMTMKHYMVPVSIDGIQERMNSGKNAILSHLVLRLKAGELSLRNLLGTDLFGDGVATGTNDDPIVGIKASSSSSAVVSTYCGLSKTTYTGLAGQYYSNSSVDRPITKSLLSRAFQAATIDNDSPTLGITTTIQFTKLCETHFANQITMKDDNLASMGFTNILFNGVPIVKDSHCTAGYFYWQNLKYYNLYVQKAGDYIFSGFQKIANQDAKGGQLIVDQCFACTQPRLQALIIDLDETFS